MAHCKIKLTPALCLLVSKLANGLTVVFANIHLKSLCCTFTDVFDQMFALNLVQYVVSLNRGYKEVN